MMVRLSLSLPLSVIGTFRVPRIIQLFAIMLSGIGNGRRHRFSPDAEEIRKQNGSCSRNRKLIFLKRIFRTSVPIRTNRKNTMTEVISHNVDRYMFDLRHILSQGRKKIGLLIGAGAPASIKVPEDDEQSDRVRPLIPAIAQLTEDVLSRLNDDEKNIIEILSQTFETQPTIEDLLTKVRRISEVIEDTEMYGFTKPFYDKLVSNICTEIGTIVGPSLPEGENSYSLLISWISGIQRGQSIEIFTPNYDLLFEEALEIVRSPYFDGFSGSFRPFFDPASVRSNSFPKYWSRLWKLHGSLGWKDESNKIVRTGSRDENNLIYPDHHKYNEISRLPFSALFERLRMFLATSDSLLLCCGFSFFDAHITAIIDEALSENPQTAVIAFQYRNLEEEVQAAKIAKHRKNCSLYAPDGAIIGGITGKWQVNKTNADNWNIIRSTFLSDDTNTTVKKFTLGDFANFSKFLSLSDTSQFDTDSLFQENNS